MKKLPIIILLLILLPLNIVWADCTAVELPIPTGLTYSEGDCGDADASTFCAATCSNGDIQTAVSAAISYGDGIVYVPEGECQWTGDVDVQTGADNDLCIIGEGKTKTKITLINNNQFYANKRSNLIQIGYMSFTSVDGTRLFTDHFCPYVWERA